MVARFGEDFSDGAGFHDPAGIHDRYTICEAGNDGEVMRDPDECRTVFARQLLDFTEDLRLDGDVECRGRFVGDQHRRLVQKRDRNRHALAHPAGKLVRIGLEPGFRRGDADRPQGFDGPRTRRSRRHAFMGGDRLHDLRVDAQNRIECGDRILKDHRNALAAQAAHLAITDAGNVFSVQQHAAAGDPAG